MIVIVQICHQFLTFSQKSTLGQITSSLSDSKIRSAEEDLGRWAQLIKDEASFLLSETTEREATENTNFRRWVAVLNDSDFRQRKIDKGLQWLSAISTYDYETPWKQARKRGSSSCFMDIASYKQWKDRQGPSSLILSGTMGSGKSVIMASMIDDLNLSCLNDTILYFFCRHDIPESLKARTVFGSLARQLLQHHIDADTMDDIFADFIPLIGLEKVLDILLIAIRRLKGVRLVLDGIDECKEEEIQLIHQGLSQLQETGDMMSCVSFRTQADGLQPRFQYAKESMSISVPDDNPDIREFIELELQRHKESGRLSLGDPILLLTIRDALLSGANGMYVQIYY